MSAIPPTVMSMRTRDGVRLDADVYSPDGQGPFPVLLMRQPYGRRIASTVTYAHPSWYAARGYLVVIQDVRGRGTSEGEFEPFIHERDDGEDTLEWVSRLPGGNGCVGMYGFSYHGATQLFAAASRHPALKVMAPAMCAFHLDRDWAYESGALRLYNTLSWAAQLGAESARRRGDADGFSACYGIGHAPSPVQLVDPAAPALRETLADTFYGDWLDQPPGSDYWRRRSPGTMLDGVDIPALHVGAGTTASSPAPSPPIGISRKADSRSGCWWALGGICPGFPRWGSVGWATAPAPQWTICNCAGSTFSSKARTTA